MALGAQYVVFTGIQLMLMLCVDNSDIQDVVKSDNFKVLTSYIINT